VRRADRTGAAGTPRPGTARAVPQGRPHGGHRACRRHPHRVRQEPRHREAGGARVVGVREGAVELRRPARRRGVAAATSRLAMAAAETASRTRPVLRGLSLLFSAASVLVLIAAWQLFVLTDHTDRFFAWTIGVPLTAAVDGAFYLAAFFLLFPA